MTSVNEYPTRPRSTSFTRAKKKTPLFSVTDFRAGFFNFSPRVWTAVMTLLMAGSFFIVMTAYNYSRFSMPYSLELYWLGIAGMYVPVFLRILLGKPTKGEMIIMIIMLGLLLYLTKLMYSPTALKFVDEQQQWRSAYNAFTANALFETNPILLISPYYPGLQNSTIGIAAAASVPLDLAGAILIGGLRVMLMLLLWVFFEEVTGDQQIAGLSCVLYMTNPGFLIFSSYLVYQSLALPMVVLSITALVRWSSAANKTRYRFAFMFLVVAGMMVVIITHHVTSYLMVLYFLVFGIVFFVLNRIRGTLWETPIRAFGRLLFGWKADTDLQLKKNNNWEIYSWLTMLLLVAIIIWVVYIALTTVRYLGPQFEGVYDEFTTFLTKQRETGSYKAPSLPTAELFLGFSSIGIIVGGVLFGIRQAMARYKLQHNIVGLVAIAGGFYFFLLLRFVSTRGGELLSRTWAFTFIALSIFLTLTILTFFNVPNRPLRWLFRPIIVLVFCIYVAGNIASGWPPYWGRLPGPYIPGGFDRSIDNTSMQLIDWVRDYIKPNSVFLSDFVTLHLLGGYGAQSPYLGAEDVFIDPVLTDYHRGLMRDAGVEYIAVDQRIASDFSPVGFYFVSWERGKYPDDKPFDIQRLLKFDDVYGFNRLYDSGSIIVYDTQEYTHSPTSP